MGDAAPPLGDAAAPAADARAVEEASGDAEADAARDAGPGDDGAERKKGLLSLREKRHKQLKAKV